MANISTNWMKGLLAAEACFKQHIDKGLSVEEAYEKLLESNKAYLCLWVPGTCVHETAGRLDYASHINYLIQTKGIS